MRALRSILGWITTTWVAVRECVGHEEGSIKRDMVKTQIRVSQERCTVVYSDVEVECPLCKEDVVISLLMMLREPTERKQTERRGYPLEKKRDLSPSVLENSYE